MQHDVRGALHLGNADTSARRKRGEDRAVRGVLEEQRARHRNASLERRAHFGRGERLAAQHAVLVGERKAHRFQVVRFDLLQGLLFVHAAQADLFRRFASKSFQYSSRRSLGPMPSTAGGPVISRAPCASSTIGGLSPAWFLRMASSRMRR